MRGPKVSPRLSRAGSRSIMVVVSDANDIILRIVHACETEILILLSASLAIKRTPPTGARISQTCRRQGSFDRWRGSNLELRCPQPVGLLQFFLYLHAEC